MAILLTLLAIASIIVTHIVSQNQMCSELLKLIIWVSVHWRPLLSELVCVGEVATNASMVATKHVQIYIHEEVVLLYYLSILATIHPPYMWELHACCVIVYTWQSHHNQSLHWLSSVMDTVQHTRNCWKSCNTILQLYQCTSLLPQCSCRMLCKCIEGRNEFTAVISICVVKKRIVDVCVMPEGLRDSN